VYHYNDAGDVLTIISLAKSNACSNKNPVNCGAASLLDGVLEVTFKTPGNGSGKVYGY
jgi:hypothetical protein